MTPDQNIDNAALNWVIRMQDPSFDGWEAFELWLEANPAHADSYQAMAIADQDIAVIAAAVPQPRPALVLQPVLQPAPRRRVPRAWFGGAIAASLAVVAGYAVLETRPAPYFVETPAGVARSLVLADGTKLDLNGGTRLRLDRRAPREAVLERGEVVFTVVHDDRRPFRVGVGSASLVDVGTIFNVSRSGSLTTVAVSEGAVVFNPDREAVHLPAGRSLRAVDGLGTIVLARTSTAAVGGWRSGRLVYDGAPLDDVAADLARNTGLAIVADPAVAGRPFRGVISLNNNHTALPAGLGLLLGVKVVRQGDGWRFAAETP
ncbi:sensor [Polymorphobacter glacialis]|uniref:Sensor n=1 Tax=Sandarakinorhabdus glacialis TaxID=1614636 RepID=A0A916ZU05_9SPHN|nr:FecR domain-containing protein [Polymorphobacter glacialis]GGE14104.1 sensor [Polymorphobacter glacialis]